MVMPLFSSLMRSETRRPACLPPTPSSRPLSPESDCLPSSYFTATRRASISSTWNGCVNSSFLGQHHRTGYPDDDR